MSHLSRTLPAFLSAALTALAIAGNAVAADPVMTATFDGKPWSATFAQAIVLSIGGNPQLNLSGTAQLNLSGTAQGSPTMTFNAMLVLKSQADMVGAYALMKDSASANFNVLEGGAMTRNVRFGSGKIVIDSYDAAAKTIAGHFDAIGKDADGTGEIHLTDGIFSAIPVSSN